MREAKGVIVVRVGRRDAGLVWPRDASVLDSLALALGVVVDVGHKGGGRSRAMQVHLNLVEQAGLVVAIPRDALVGCGQLDGSVERVVGCAAGVGAVAGDPLKTGWGLCCASHGNMAFYYAWDAILQCNGGTAKVNLLLNRASHMLDIELYGLKPGMHHFTNLIIHIVNSLLLFFVINWMTGKLWRSAFVAAYFALHPLNVESIAWVAERKNVLSTFFGS